MIAWTAARDQMERCPPSTWNGARDGVEYAIPIAEQAGLLDDLVLRLIRTACTQASAWRGDFQLSFNLAPTQFLDPSIVDRVAAAAHAGGLPMRRICIEITESSLFHSHAAARHAVEAFKAAGASLALDDFGTGHSSLTRLQALPFDEIKIDSGFVRALESDPNSLKIVSAVLGLGQSLGVHVVAEGIESERQAQLLEGMGCEFGQGYLWGTPMPLDQAAARFPSSGGWPAKKAWQVDTSPFQRLHQLESLYEAAPVGLGFLDTQLRVVSANARLSELLGLDLAAAAGSPVQALWQGQATPDIEAVLQRVLAGETVLPIEYRIPNSKTTSLLALQPVRCEAKQPLGVSVVAIDISEKMAARRTLERSVEHFRHIVRLAPSIPWAATPDGTVDYMGPTYEWTPMSTSAERYAQWRTRMDKADQIRVRAEWLEHLPSKTHFRTEFRILWPDNTWKWVRSQAFPSLDEHGAVVRWFGVISDVSSERKLMERVAELESQLDRLQNASKASQAP